MWPDRRHGTSISPWARNRGPAGAPPVPWFPSISEIWLRQLEAYRN